MAAELTAACTRGAQADTIPMTIVSMAIRPIRSRPRLLLNRLLTVLPVFFAALLVPRAVL